MSIALSLANNLTTGGKFIAAAINNTSVSNVTSFASIPAGGVLRLLSTQTASDSASISFTNDGSAGLTTYKEYIFSFINIHQAATSFASFDVGFRDGSTDYDAPKQTAKFEVYHTEADSTSLAYSGGDDLANGTAFQRIGLSGYNNDESMSGFMRLFEPSSTTFTKHFISTTNAYYTGSNASWQEHVGGYINTTTAIDGVQFKMSTGNIQSGVIKMYGVL